MNPTYYNRLMAYVAANNFDLWGAGIIIGGLALIGVSALSKIYLYSTFGVLIRAYFGKGDVMIRKDAARYCVECDTIFDIDEGKLVCPAAATGNLYH